MSNDYKQTASPGFWGGRFGGFVKAMLIAVGFTVLVFFICALLLTYTGLSESAIPFIVIITAVTSVILAGTVTGKRAGQRGYLNGALTGVAYMALLYVISLLVGGDFYFGTYILILLIIGLFGGAFGGILGINLSLRRRR